MILRSFFSGLFLMTVFSFQSPGQKVNSTISRYLGLTSATYHWHMQGMVRKKPAPQGPKKIYNIEFLVKRDCKLSMLTAFIGVNKVSGKILYDNNSSDSVSVKKGTKVVLEFMAPEKTPGEGVESTKKGLIRVSFCINSTKVSLSTTFNEKKQGINEPLYQ